METREPTLISKLGYPSAGLLSIVGLVVGLWTVYHLLVVGSLTLYTAILAYFVVVGVFGFLYSEFWLADITANREYKKH